MIRIAAVCAALALPTLASAQTLTLDPPKAPQVGDSMTEVETQDLSMDMAVVTPDGQTMNMNTTENGKESVRYEILAIGPDGAVTSIKITVDEDTTTSAQGERSQTHKGPLEGLTFVLTKAGEQVEVTDGEGGALEPPQAMQAKQAYANKLGKRTNKFAEVFDKESYTVGDTITIDGDRAKEIFADDPNEQEEMQDMSLVLTLKALDKVDGHPVAVFDAVMTMGGEPQPGMKIGAKLEGTLTILTATSDMHSMKLSGPMTLSADKDGMKMDGEGTMTMETKRSYGG